MAYGIWVLNGAWSRWDMEDTHDCVSSKELYGIPVLVTRLETVLYDFKHDFKGKMD